MFSRWGSPETLAADSDGELALTPISTGTSSLTTHHEQDLFTQLLEQAKSADSNACHEAIMTQSSSASTSVSGYDSDRTDFLLTCDFPSLRKSKPALKRSTGAKNRHFKKKTQFESKLPPIRRLNFGSTLKKRHVKNTKKSANAQSLDNLRNIERSPSHRWDEDEREFLCVMNRWYCATDRATELTIFAEVFNSITGLALRPRIIRNQYEGHLRLYGGEAYREFGRVFLVPFDDPEGRYAEIRALIEAEAEALGLDLQKRQTDSKFPSGMAKFAKSSKTRTTYKSLVTRVSQEAEWDAARAAVPMDASMTARSIATMSMAVKMPSEEEWEIVTDAEASPKPSAYNEEVPRSAFTKPHLTFRVWDEANRTKFIDGGFVAQTFLDWPRPLPAPIAPDDPSQAGRILMVLHLSKQGDTPVFISTASVSIFKGT